MNRVGYFALQLAINHSKQLKAFTHKEAATISFTYILCARSATLSIQEARAYVPF